MSEAFEKIQRELAPVIEPKKVSKNIRSIKEERIFRQQNEKFKYYVPNAKCEEFITKVGELNPDGKPNFVVLFSAANGVGKTCVSANIVAHLLWGNESKNPYFNHPLFKNFPFPKKGRIISDPENLKVNLIPTLKEWFPLGRYNTTKSSKQYDSVWTIKNSDWEFDIMSYEQDPKEFESATLGWAWFDEPPPEAIFKATVSRMRKGGIIFISETPLYAAWLYDHIVANPDTELAAKGQRVYIEAGVEAACIQHGIRGHLEHEHIERMNSEYSEDEKQARIYGKFQHLVGRRFKAFSRNVHVIKPFILDPKDWVVHHALDTHPRVNDAGIWLAINRKGTKVIVDEFWEKCSGGTSEMAARIKKKNDQYRITRKLLEPAAFVKDQHTDLDEETLAEKLSGYGLNYYPATKNRTMSDKRIEDALAFQKIVVGDHEEYFKAPELFIFDTCPRTIFEIERLSWQEWKGKAGENKDKNEKVVDKDDHMIEDIGRILILEPQFEELPIYELPENGGEINYDPYAR
jgi:phage terminase large subunit-like protein